MYKYSNDTVKVKIASPITLIQAKDQLSVEHDFVDDDRLILSKIKQATAYIEDRTGIDISETANTKEYYDFDGIILEVKESPLKELKRIKKEVDNVETELVEGTDYLIEKRKTYFNIRFEESQSGDKLTMEFDTGYDLSNIPFPLESAILIKINDLYDMERTSYTVGANFRRIDPIESLIASYTVNRWSL